MEFSDMTNGTIETFDAVLADLLDMWNRGGCLSMIHLDRLAAAHAAEKSTWFLRAREEAERCGQAEARAEAAERDAGRYRWLRDEAWGTNSGIECPCVHMTGHMGESLRGMAGVLDGDDLDAAMDAAIATTEQADAS